MVRSGRWPHAGPMILVETSPQGYRGYGSFMIPDIASFSWSHPVIANDRLFLREQDSLSGDDTTASLEVVGGREDTGR